MKRLVLPLFALLIATPAQARPITVKDLLAVKWISSVALHPSGKEAAFVIKLHDYDNNGAERHIWRVTTNKAPGDLRQLTNSPAGESSPAYSPDGKYLAFVSGREGGTPPIWPLPPGGGQARPPPRPAPGPWRPGWCPGRRVSRQWGRRRTSRRKDRRTRWTRTRTPRCVSPPTATAPCGRPSSRRTPPGGATRSWCRRARTRSPLPAGATRTGRGPARAGRPRGRGPRPRAARAGWCAGRPRGGAPSPGGRSPGGPRRSPCRPDPRAGFDGRPSS